MRGVGKLILTLGLIVVLASPAAAQQRQRGQRGQRGPGGVGQGGFAMLVNNEDVQKELKLEKDQVDKAKSAVQGVQKKHQEELTKLRDLSQEERREKGQELNRTISEESLQALGEVLKPEQIKRLKQIEMQQAGVRAFIRPDVQKALNLTDQQKESIKTIEADSAKAMRELFAGGNAQGGGRDRMATLRKETTDKIQGVLTSEQKTTWKELTGEPFEVR